MKGDRKEFLKFAGMTGLSLTGASLISSCDSTGNKGDQVTKKDWHTDPEWREVKYGPWGGPGIPPGPGPMDDVLLKNHAPKSTLVTRETFVPEAKFPVIDVHIHNYPARENSGSPEKHLSSWVETMDEVGVETSVVLTGATGEEFNQLTELYLQSYPDRFQLYCGIESEGIGQDDYPERAIAELERCYKQGARGIGEISDKGFGITRDPQLAPEERLHHDDPRLDGVWEKAAELNLPVNIHIADHPSSWEPPNVYQERSPIFQRFNQHDSDGLPYEDLISILPRLLKRHPDTTFIACHLANLGNDLRRLSDIMDQHDNLYLDISARDYEVGRQPRGARRFLQDYQDRVMFGTDMGMDKGMYHSWWRLLETTDEYMTGRIWWPYYGLDLSDSMLESLYRANAKRIMNWEQV